MSRLHEPSCSFVERSPLWNATLVKMLEGWNVTLCLSRLPVTLAVNECGWPDPAVLPRSHESLSPHKQTALGRLIQCNTQMKLKSNPNRAWWVAQLSSTCVFGSVQTGASEIAQFQRYTNFPVRVSNSCSSGWQQLLSENGSMEHPDKNEWTIDDMSRSTVNFVVSTTSLILRLSFFAFR